MCIKYKSLPAPRSQLFNKTNFQVAWNKPILNFWGGNHDLSFVGNAAIAGGYVTGYTTKGESDSFAADLTSNLHKVSKRASAGDRTKKQVLFDLGAKMRTSRKVAHHEMIWRVAGYPYAMNTRQFVYVNPLPVEMRMRFVPKCNADLATMDKKDVVLRDAPLGPCKLTRAYMGRPQSGTILIVRDDRELSLRATDDEDNSDSNSTSSPTPVNADFLSGVPTVTRTWETLSFHEFLANFEILQESRVPWVMHLRGCPFPLPPNNLITHVLR